MYKLNCAIKFTSYLSMLLQTELLVIDVRCFSMKGAVVGFVKFCRFNSKSTCITKHHKDVLFAAAAGGYKY